MSDHELIESWKVVNQVYKYSICLSMPWSNYYFSKVNYKKLLITRGHDWFMMLKVGLGLE